MTETLVNLLLNLTLIVLIMLMAFFILMGGVFLIYFVFLGIMDVRDLWYDEKRKS